MFRKFLIAILAIAVLIELCLTVGILFFREQTLQSFGISMGDGTAFMGYIIGWFAMVVTLVCAWALVLTVRQKPGFAILCYILGFWWIAIGIGIYINYNKPDNLLIDSVKGVLIVLCTYGTSKEITD